MEQQNPNMKWYMVSTKAKLEKKAKENIETAIRKQKQESLFGEILVPEMAQTELVKGQKQTKMVALFPNYILVQMVLTNESMNVVKTANHVNGFVGDHQKPQAVAEHEVQKIVDRMNNTTSAPANIKFVEGDLVKITDGPFKDFTGAVDAVKPDKAKISVLVTVFGRATPVELNYDQVQKHTEDK